MTKENRNYLYQMTPRPKGEIIRQWIADSGLTIREIEEKYGITRMTLYRAMKGYRIRHTTLKKLAQIIGINWWDLVEEW